MHFKMTLIALFLPLVMTGCALFDGMTTVSPDLTVGETVTITGELASTIDDCTFDGICALVLDTEQGEVAAIWATGMMRCEGQFTGDVPQGQSVEVYGLVVEDLRGIAAVSICTDNSHYIRLLDS